MAHGLTRRASGSQGHIRPFSHSPIQSWRDAVRPDRKILSKNTRQHNFYLEFMSNDGKVRQKSFFHRKDAEVIFDRALWDCVIWNRHCGGKRPVVMRLVNDSNGAVMRQWVDHNRVIVNEHKVTPI